MPQSPSRSNASAVATLSPSRRAISRWNARGSTPAEQARRHADASRRYVGPVRRRELELRRRRRGGRRAPCPSRGWSCRACSRARSRSARSARVALVHPGGEAVDAGRGVRGLHRVERLGALARRRGRARAARCCRPRARARRGKTAAATPGAPDDAPRRRRRARTPPTRRAASRTRSGRGQPASSRQVEPDPVAQLDPVDLDPGRVAVRGRERVALDRAHPEAEPLVEAQVAGVRRAGGDAQHLDPLIRGRARSRRRRARGRRRGRGGPRRPPCS